MTFLPKDMASEVFDLIPIYIKPKTKVRIPEIIQKEVLDWLKSLDFTSLFEVFMITDYQITQTILQMTRKLLLSNQGYFLRTHKEVLRPMYSLLIIFSLIVFIHCFLFVCEINPYFVNVNLKYFPYFSEKPEDFDRFFFSRKDPPDPPSVDFNKKLQSYQELIFSHLRIFEKDRRFDSLCFSGDFLTNSLDQLFEVFSFISGNELFKHVCKTDLPINDWVWEMPFWFSLNNYQSIAAWIVGLMEREVWKKFFQAKKKQRKKSGNGVKIFLNQDSVLIKKNDLLEFWKELDKANRRKVGFFKKFLKFSIY